MKDVSFLDDMLSGITEEEVQPKPVTGDNSFTLLNLDAIEPDAGQPRQYMDESALREMADSILRHGILQPITVTALGDGKYRLVSGERRWRAACLARDRGEPCARAGYDLQCIPALIVTIPEDDGEILERQLIENLVREDMSLPDTAMALKRLMESTGESAPAIARRIGKSAPWVRQVLAFAHPDLEPRLERLGVRGEDVPIALAQQILACTEDALDWMRDRIAEGAALNRELMAACEATFAGPTVEKVTEAAEEPAGDAAREDSRSQGEDQESAEDAGSLEDRAAELLGSRESGADDAAFDQEEGEAPATPVRAMTENRPEEDTNGADGDSVDDFADGAENSADGGGEVRALGGHENWLSITLPESVWKMLLDAARMTGKVDARTVQAAIEKISA